MKEKNNENVSLRWQRSPGPLRVWKIVEARSKTENALPLNFSIQDIPNDRYDEVLDLLCKYYIPDEPICESLHVKDDPLAIKDFRNEWREVLHQGVSVGAFFNDPNLNKSVIVGVNILYVGSKKEDDCMMRNMLFKSECAEKIVNTFWKLLIEANVLAKYGTDTYLGAIGLCVHPQFRELGLAKCLLDSRIIIGKEFGVPNTSTIFTGPSSQLAAERSGFEILLEKHYDELKDESGNIIFPVRVAKSIKVMSKRLF